MNLFFLGISRRENCNYHFPQKQRMNQMDPIVASMLEELSQANEVYQPSSFWTFVNETNFAMLDDLGLERFKQTIAQNYYNWMILSVRDNQFRSAARHWAHNPTVRPFLNRLTVPDFLRTLHLKEGDLRPWHYGIYKIYVGMLWEYCRRSDWTGLSDRISEPLIGRPIEIQRKGKLISQDLANSIREYHAILEDDRGSARRFKRVAELGAGYGRLGHAFLSAGSTQYFIFDIPPALKVSQWYLSRIFPERKIFHFRHIDNFEDVRSQIESCDVAFFTPNQLELFPEQWFDYFVSISTLPEMSARQIGHYLNMISRYAGKYIYLKQWLRWKNPRDGNEVVPTTFSFAEPWELRYDRKDAIQDLFAERLWRRR